MAKERRQRGSGGRGGGVAWWALVLAGLGHGVVLSLALPPVGVWPLTLAAVAPLVWAGTRGAARPVKSAVLAGLGGLPIWLGQQAWLIDVTAAGYPLLALYMCLYPALFVWLIAKVRQVGVGGVRVPLALAVGVLWTGVEVLRGEVLLTGYAWFGVGHAIIEQPGLAAPASLLGAYFITFLVAALSGALADAAGWGSMPRRVGGISAAAIVLLWGGASALGSGGWGGRGQVAGEGGAQRVPIAVVQTNLPQSNKLGWSVASKLAEWRKWAELIRQAAVAAERPEIIILPETMFPGMALNPDAIDVERRAGLQFRVGGEGPGTLVDSTVFADELLELQKGVGTPIMIGASASEGLRIESRAGSVDITEERRFNSVFVVSGGRVLANRYDKIDLTPFGEMIPYVWRFPAIERWVLSVGAGGMKFDLSSGKEARPLVVPRRGGTTLVDDERVGPVTVATPICFEVTRSGLCRRLVYDQATGRRAADLIVNVSNDGWFGWWDGGREQHLQLARWRCVELGIPMVRSVNTGVSAFIDADGRVQPIGTGGVRWLGTGRAVRNEGVLVGSVVLEPGGTLFGRVGNVWGWTMLGLTGVAAPWAVVLGRRRPRAA